jgi:16S rRNA (guanine527-N7)-methyltransferase
MEKVARAARWSGWELDADQVGRLEQYGAWLRDEAIPAGGLGPNEADRIEDRHLADSLLLGGGWGQVAPPEVVADLGTGVGLPGIPLAVMWPNSRMVLVDRSGRRVDLVRRAIRVLGLRRVEVVQADAGEVALDPVDMVVARAVAGADHVRRWAERLLRPGGVAAVGGSWVEPPQPVPGESVVEVPAEVLDRPVWIRIMAAS